MKRSLGQIVIALFLLPLFSVHGDELQQQIEYVKQEYLACVHPLRQSVSDLPPELQSEVARRILIVEDTWPDYLAGRRDATNTVALGRYVLQGYAPLTEIEEDYVTRLKNRYGIDYVPVEAPVTNIHKWIYIHAFNSEMEKSFSDTHGKCVLGYTLQEAITNHGYATYTCSSYFFVPYRFGFSTRNVEPLHESPKPKTQQLLARDGLKPRP